ncbi:MAG: hypothetical protein M3065_06200 [Actinomycetota bacterium]|nr:hypothetical protein [Actinomycetota bacterium]
MSRIKLAVLIAVGVVAGAGTSVALAGATQTRVIVYQAFTSAGKPAIHVTSTSRGHCAGGSAAINRADAWRCLAGNLVYDPCLSSTKATGIVLCPLGPWTSSSAEIKLTSRLTGANKGKPSTSGHPWAIETSSDKCVAATGATSILDHLRANYYCQTTKNALWGYPSRTSEPWTIYSAPGTATKLTRKVAIRVAWF